MESPSPPRPGGLPHGEVLGSWLNSAIRELGTRARGPSGAPRSSGAVTFRVL